MKLLKRLKENINEYRCVPFWSWNDKLEEKELRRQIRFMKRQGSGGFFMHARGGLLTEYLSDDWFEAVKTSIDEARKQGMDAYAYDENGWPSGFAGMRLLSDPANFAHYLTCKEVTEFDESALGVFAVEDGRLIRLNRESPLYSGMFAVYDNTNSSVVDILDSRVTDRFVAETHEEYDRRLNGLKSSGLKGFFTDEPQYFRWETAYSPVAADEYFRRYNEKLSDVIGGLFAECEGCARTRWRYWTVMNDLYVSNFAGRIYDYLDERGIALTGHSVEERSLSGQMSCCAGVMPFYEYQHIPGIDFLGRGVDSEISPRQCSSVARQTGRKRVLSETFACTGWDVTPLELKKIAEFQYVAGVNLMCQHLMPYSVRGQRKRDYPPAFSEHNPWACELKDFNDYFARLGTIIGEGNEYAPAAVIHPIGGAYLRYRRETDYESVREEEEAFVADLAEINRNNVFHHYADESIMSRRASVKDGKLRIGEVTYSAVILPHLKVIKESTAKLLKELIRQGGRVCVMGEPPFLIEGERADTSFIKSTCGLDELSEESEVRFNGEGEPRFAMYYLDDCKILYAVNSSEQEVSGELSAKGDFVRGLDLSSLKIWDEKFEPAKNGYMKKKFKLRLGELTTFILSGEAAVNSRPPAKGGARERVSIPGEFELETLSDNYIVADQAELIRGGKSYGKMSIPAVNDALLKERINGPVTLRYRFEIKELPEGSVKLVTEDMRLTSVKVNDAPVRLKRGGGIDKSYLSCGVTDLLKTGENVVETQLDFYQRDQVYKVLFDCPEGTESLKNCLSFDTSIENIWLCGDFGAYGEGIKRTGQNTLICETPFYIGAKPKRAAGDLTSSGLAFFSGRVSLKRSFFLKEAGETVLSLCGRYASAEVIINGKKAGKLQLTDRLEVTDFIRRGENQIELILTSGNRNLFGPHHYIEEEPLGVNPFMFDMQGSFEGKTSPYYKNRTALVRFGVDSIELF